jgi:surface carbohydrate biosynthesis protein
MNASIKCIWRYLCYLFSSRKVWTWPQQSEVLIYDAANREILLEYLKPWDPEILHVRKEQINVRVLLKSFFRKGRGVNAYIDCFIEKVRPRLIVTIVDNKSTFYRISGRHPDVKTLFIQNGLRSYFPDIFMEFDKLDSNTLDTFLVDYMLVFGSAIGERYSRYLKGNVLPAGAIKNNFVRKENLSQPGVIAFVSQFRANQGFYAGDTFFSFEDFRVKPEALVIQCLMRYVKENNKRLVIITCYHYNGDLYSQEKDYFRGIMGVEPEFYKPSGPYSSYLAVNSVEIVVAIDSSFGYESIARAKKTAVFSIRGTMNGITDRNFGWPANFPDEGPFWTNKPDPDIFVRILDYLFDVTDEQWQEDLKSANFSSIMEYDPENKILQSILEKELAPPPELTS